MKNSPYSQVFLSSEHYNSKKIYKNRRQALLKKLDSFSVFAGMEKEPGGEEAFNQTYTRIMQEPAFLYLTGINQPGCYLLLDPTDGAEILFIPKKDLFKEFWTGKKLGYVEGNNEVSKVTGIEDVRPVEELWDTLGERGKKCKSIGFAYAYFFKDFKGDHNDLFQKKMEKCLKNLGIKVKSVADLHWKLRLPLEKERIQEAREAQQITKEAFLAVLGNMSTLDNERQLGLFLDYEMQRRSYGDLAFPTIVAGGENACCLHYVKKDQHLCRDLLVLLDFGIRVGTLHSDISRTFPVGGKFNPLQKMLYEIVLDAQREYESYVKPGVTLKKIGMIPWNFIVNALETKLVQGCKGKYKLLYDKQPHGVSHFIGEQIHEGQPNRKFLDVVLEPGMLISCEPGLYGEFWCKIGGKSYHEKIGIRIEDDLLITKNGCENISKDIPKTVAELENLIR